MLALKGLSRATFSYCIVVFYGDVTSPRVLIIINSCRQALMGADVLTSPASLMSSHCISDIQCEMMLDPKINISR